MALGFVFDCFLKAIVLFHILFNIELIAVIQAFFENELNDDFIAEARRRLQD